MKKGAIFGLITGASLALVLACGGGESTTTTSSPTQVPTKVAETSSAASATTSSSGAADITIEMQDVPGYAYLPADIEMNAGETYNIRLVGSDEFHTWSLADGNGGWIANISLNPNAEQTVSFTAPAAGTYEIICLPHQANDMVGTLTVN